MPLAQTLYELYKLNDNYHNTQAHFTIVDTAEDNQNPREAHRVTLVDSIRFLSERNSIRSHIGNKTGNQFVDSFVLELPYDVKINYVGAEIMEKFRSTQTSVESVVLLGQMFYPSLPIDLCKKYMENSPYLSINEEDIRFKNLLHKSGDSHSSLIQYSLVLKVNSIIDNIYNVEFSMRFASIEYMYCLDNGVKLVEYVRDDENNKFSGDMLDDSFTLLMSLSFSFFAQDNLENIITKNSNKISAPYIFNLVPVKLPKDLLELIPFNQLKYKTDCIIDNTNVPGNTKSKSLLAPYNSEIKVSYLI